MSTISVFKEGQLVYQGKGSVTHSLIKGEVLEEPKREFTASSTIKLSKRTKRTMQRRLDYAKRCKREVEQLEENYRDRVALTRFIHYGGKIPLYLRRKYKNSVNNLMRGVRLLPYAVRKKIRP